VTMMLVRLAPEVATAGRELPAVAARSTVV
jgi:hypothetical protein